ncbi:cation diffusion facilitator family transporter [Aneurinibacillus soli]|uniref:Putative cation efflux system protein/MT2084 n=1 Tax=Aneurinibacillus soli TaxID=1500254 RepID=A0A0U5B892_9BACL|nr:cation diffusion facilitator family transporter [Aneurinibacillus soli]PYE60104.1 cation diffusion facilitator family transporter [Aneurinibacillus soli]BAU26407.1 putative cation efflux system protein/MT2084 [Aneurinibacillus soli]
MEEQYNNLKQGERGAWLSIIVYILLSAGKLAVGYWTNSEALLADGLNNTTDIMASIAVLVGLRLSQKPPDLDHPYGHWRAETVASMIASFIMMTVGLQVLYNAVKSLMNFQEIQMPDTIAMWVALVSAGIMYGVYHYNRRLGERIQSQAVTAAAQDNLSDAWVSIGAAVGIAGAQFGLPWLDPVAAFIVGLMICRTAWGIFSVASLNLTDGFDETELDLLRQTIEEMPEVKALTDIKARAHGNRVLVDVVIQVNPQLTVLESHRITENIEEKMHREHNILNVHVHVEPL